MTYVEPYLPTPGSPPSIEKTKPPLNGKQLAENGGRVSENKEDPHLRGIVEKIQKLSNEKYEGMIYENILPIYSCLNEAEQKILLRGFIGLFLVFDLTSLENMTPIDDFSKRERIRIQMFMVKFLMVLVGCLFLGGLGLIYMLGLDVFSGSQIDTMFEKLIKLIQVVLMA